MLETTVNGAKQVAKVTTKVAAKAPVNAAEALIGNVVTAGLDVRKVEYNPFDINQISAAQGLDDIEVIKPQSRDEYVEQFKSTEERTAKATLDMCRVVYEAKQTLAEHDFADFCSAIGYKDDSSVIRKFCAIGKLQPRLVKHAALMPHEWTKIYTITQIPARVFEHYVEQKLDFRGMKNHQLKQYLAATQPERKTLSELIPRDKDSYNFVIARIMFTKSTVDAFDWRAVKKALAEVESRLPVKVQFVPAADHVYKNTIMHRYAASKANAKRVDFNPALWDFGTEAAQANLRADDSWLTAVNSTAAPTAAKQQ